MTENKIEFEQSVAVADPWYVRAIRPIVTLVMVGSLAGVLVHGAIWLENDNAFESMMIIGSMILAFWFGGREANKPSK